MPPRLILWLAANLFLYATLSACTATEPDPASRADSTVPVSSGAPQSASAEDAAAQFEANNPQLFPGWRAPVSGDPAAVLAELLEQGFPAVTQRPTGPVTTTVPPGPVVAEIDFPDHPAQVVLVPRVTGHYVVIAAGQVPGGMSVESDGSFTVPLDTSVTFRRLDARVLARDGAIREVALEPGESSASGGGLGAQDQALYLTYVSDRGEALAIAGYIVPPVSSPMP